MFGNWNPSQQGGTLLLVILVLVVQWLFFLVSFKPQPQVITVENFTLLNAKIDSLVQAKKQPKHFAFNPNFLSDYAAERWGMPAEAFNRLSAFRSEGKFVHTATEFQSVTGISDSLLVAMQPYFKFPEWVQKKQAQEKNSLAFKKAITPTIHKKDINTAQLTDLQALRGIGEVIAQRIINYRNKLGGFALMEQLSEVWGLSPEVITELNKYFTVITLPNITKLNLNTATKYELAKIPYLNSQKIEQILLYRSKNGVFLSLEQILQLPHLEHENIRKLSIYLTVE